MSYILDALKKAEQKREQEQLISKLTFSGKLPPERKKRSFWPYLLLAALLLNTVVIAFLVSSPWLDKGGTIAQRPMLPQSAPTEDKNRVRETLKDSKEAPQKKDVIGFSSAPLSAKAIATKGTPTEQKKGQEKRVMPPIDRLYNLSELPPAVKSALPEFRVSGHAYSPDRQTRVTRVNEKILQEGQELTPGLRVEEIIPAGIIFSYQGYRFRVGTSENR